MGRSQPQPLLDLTRGKWAHHWHARSASGYWGRLVTLRNLTVDKEAGKEELEAEGGFDLYKITQI